MRQPAVSCGVFRWRHALGCAFPLMRQTASNPRCGGPASLGCAKPEFLLRSCSKICARFRRVAAIAPGRHRPRIETESWIAAFRGRCAQRSWRAVEGTECAVAQRHGYALRGGFANRSRRTRFHVQISGRHPSQHVVPLRFLTWTRAPPLRKPSSIGTRSTRRTRPRKN